MRRLIALVVAAVISCVLISPPSQAMQWDPKYPPIPVDRQPNLDKPSGDDDPWDEIKSAHDPGDSWLFELDWTNWILIFVPISIHDHSIGNTVREENGPLPEPSTGLNR